MRGITPCLWFDDQAEEAAKFYTAVFRNSRILSTNRYGKSGPGPEGSVMTVSFELLGQPFLALNGGPMFHFNEAVSFIANCEGQEEVDFLWDALSDGGQEGQCGWLKDRYGVSWQIIPTILAELMGDADPAVAQRVMQTMLRMQKIDIGALRRAQGQA